MPNGDPTWQNPSLLSEWPQGQAPSPMAVPGGPAPTPPTPPPEAPGTPAAPTSLPSAGLDLSSQGPQPAPAMPAANQQGLPPAYTGPANRGGPVKNALTRMMYGMGQAMMAHVGLPTDYDIQKQQFNQAIQANDLALKQAEQQRLQQAQQFQQTLIPVQNEQGYTMYLPQSVAAKYYPAQLAASSRVQAAQIGKQYISVPNVGLVNTHIGEPGVEPEVVEGTKQPSITVTQDHVNRYGLDPQLVGQTLPTSQFASELNAAARWAPQTRTGVQNLVTANGIVQAPVSSTTQRGRPLPPTIAAPAPAGGGGGVPPAAVNQMPAGSPARNTIAGGGTGPTVRPLQTPQGGPVMPLAAFNEFDSKYLQPANAVEKSYQMMNTAYNEYQAAKAKGATLPTGAQSMVALSQHLATTFGGVKGARITKDLIAAHLGARNISDDALAAVQKFTNGDPLTSDQWDAFHSLIGQSRNITWQLASQYGKARNLDVTPYLPGDLRQNLGTGAAQPGTWGQQFGVKPK